MDFEFKEAGRLGTWRRSTRRRKRIEERDCVSVMRILRERPEALAAALREMGVTTDGDEEEV
jgi:hypothetical protein